jgi:hypothetical protein
VLRAGEPPFINDGNVTGAVDGQYYRPSVLNQVGRYIEKERGGSVSRTVVSLSIYLHDAIIIIIIIIIIINQPPFQLCMYVYMYVCMYVCI